ncbi:MAG: poly(3-hydroxyalkanoate) depolymerase [Frankiales bacterium]|nr:poly(3-hydroxyalkanoate) depolymerase [Frankiales bacterium]
MTASVQQQWNPLFQTVTVDGRRIRVAVQGEGPVLLLLNGIGANIEMWAPLVRGLPGRRVVMFDFPGTGASQALRRSRRMSGLARLVADLLEVLDVEQADVLGYSWGGALAQQLAHQHPERVRSLVLAATIPGIGGQPPAPWVVAAMATPTRYYSPRYLRVVSPLIFGTRLSVHDENHSARRERPPTMRGYSQQLFALTGWSSLPFLAKLRVPTLVLSGEGDPLAPARNGRLLARRIRGARLEVVRGGHLFLLQHPVEAARLVHEFLTAQDAARQVDAGSTQVATRSTT